MTASVSPALRTAVFPGIATLFLSAAARLSAVTLNLTDITVNGVSTTTYTGMDNQARVGGLINGALFQRSTPGSGSGQFRQLFRMSDNNDPDTVEIGYNRGGVLDSQTPNGFQPVIRVQDLVETTEGGFYMFALDANESNGGGNNYLSLDMFQIFVGGVTDPVSLPTTEANLGQLGTQVYTFSTNDAVLLDANTGSGSGTADMFVFMPTSLFSGFAPDSLVYVYARHGAYNAPGFDTASGFEEWASITIPQPTFLPEPSTALLGGLSLLYFTRRRRNPV
jgi:hypothetical protein